MTERYAHVIPAFVDPAHEWPYSAVPNGSCM
jgi:hypothetical protein